MPSLKGLFITFIAMWIVAAGVILLAMQAWWSGGLVIVYGILTVVLECREDIAQEENPNT